MPTNLHLLTEGEVEDLRRNIAEGLTPTDLQRKLNGLSEVDLVQYDLQRKARIIVCLLAAIREGGFGPAPLECEEHLLHVVAYLRKDNDAIPDQGPEGGWVDDLAEMREAWAEHREIITRFNDWRLKQQSLAGFRPAALN